MSQINTMRPQQTAVKPDGYDRWVCVYPAYITKSKSRAEGRKINKEKAVLAPTLTEMRDVLTSTGLEFNVEPKMYCRENSREPQSRGRFRVQMKTPIGELSNTNFKTREDLLLFMAEKIPELKSRVNSKPSQETVTQNKQSKSKKK